VLAFAVSTPAALFVGALLTGTAAIVTAWAGLVRAKGEARREGAADCEQHLAAARAEAERVAALLHSERIARDLEGDR
jgi:hypothetical protein